MLASDTGAYRGHPAAIVAEGEPFTVDDLAALWSRPNGRECLAESCGNSWQHSASIHDWITMFHRVQSLCKGR